MKNNSDSDPEPEHGLILTERQQRNRNIVELKIENKLIVKKIKDLNEHLSIVISDLNFLVSPEDACKLRIHF